MKSATPFHGPDLVGTLLATPQVHVVCVRPLRFRRVCNRPPGGEQMHETGDRGEPVEVPVRGRRRHLACTQDPGIRTRP